MNLVSKNKKSNTNDLDTELLLSPKDFFSESLDKALTYRKVKVDDAIKGYLVSVLEFYLETQNLFETEKVDETGKRKPQTLAELYLSAINSEIFTKLDLLKKLGDRTLYICGFFGDSLQRKLVDLDYYADMGGNAYYLLSKHTEKSDPLSSVYAHISKRFLELVDVLNYISESSMVSNNQSLLRLYDKYLQTGSSVAKDKLLELGILTLPVDQQKKYNKQN